MLTSEVYTPMHMREPLAQPRLDTLIVYLLKFITVRQQLIYGKVASAIR